jgi:catechol 2,3-dioxygenase-like lactoylglutathione lyase family enzyme
MTDPALGTTSIAQLGIIVRDVEAKARAWSTILGLPMPQISVTDTVEVAHTTYQGHPSAARAKLAFFHMGPIDVELIEPIDGPSTWQDHLTTHGESMHHIAFRVQGMDEKLAYLEAKGIRPVQRGDYAGGRYTYVDGVEQLGLILELLEDENP